MLTIFTIRLPTATKSPTLKPNDMLAAMARYVEGTSRWELITRLQGSDRAAVSEGEPDTEHSAWFASCQEMQSLGAKEVCRSAPRPGLSANEGPIQQRCQEEKAPGLYEYKETI